VVRDIRRQNDQRAVVVRERGQQTGFGRLNVAPDPSPEIELPAGLDPDLGLPPLERTAPPADGTRRRALAGPEVLDGANGLLRLREYATGGDPQLGSDLEDPHTSLPEREVVAVRPLDQAIQDRIVEGCPPVPVRGGSGADPSVPGLEPAVRY